MDDTQQQTTQPAYQPSDTPVSTMGDVAGMTPPPAPVMPAEPMASAPVQEPSAPATTEENYSAAEDILNEILDSLDRIEAKLEAMEKKMG